MPAAIERLVNLALFLASAREPVATERVREEVLGYPEDQDDVAFERMFERDKEHLREAGLVIDSTPDGRNRLDTASTFVTDVALSPQDTSVVRTVAAALLGDPTFPYAEDLRCAITKVAAFDTAPAPAFVRLADEDPAAQGERVTAISAAATARKRVSFAYTNSAGDARAHEIEPLGLFVREGRWYVVGRDTTLDEVRVYAVSRISDLTVGSTRPKTPDFERPVDFDVRTFIGLPFQYGADEPFEATLLFTPQAAWRATGLTAGIGTLEEASVTDAAPDGAARGATSGPLTWTVTARDRRRLLRWMIVNGPGIEVVSPLDLAEDLEYGLDEVMTNHG